MSPLQISGWLLGAFQVSWQTFCNLSWQVHELCITVVGTAMLKYVVLAKIDYKSTQSTKQGAHEVGPIWWLEVPLLRPILVSRSGPGGPIYCMMSEFVLHKICMVLESVQSILSDIPISTSHLIWVITTNVLGGDQCGGHYSTERTGTEQKSSVT